ncbi:uncharacterized protein LOC110105450 [Dendrobium catenatum]|uniref:Vacuolar protein sorting-associated protein 62 n=1 Tax=Dendrobium catenatum TaxID=906689 RepID=A0A2I0WU99_9ASPA|nr:uncharacterized protein LOC110105450 [Dendrobium catenatum]XP_028551058.1 uncharacterized protein LOC110105450 [Dendrobium catenatum]PKU79242.1 hypothetical protein MA16_Dca000586 [Dendrobium catenatum]
MDPYRILVLLSFFLRLHEGWATAVQGGQFAKGSIEVGGLELREHTTFTKIWTAAPLNSGDSSATFFSPSSLPSGFFPLGSHAQSHTPNPSPTRALIARDTANSLASPTDFTVLFSSNFSSPSPVFFWLPIPPPGYTAAGHVITTSPQKPPLSSLRCLPNHLLEPCHSDAPTWSPKSDLPFTVHLSYSLGTFVAGGEPPLHCLKKNDIALAAMPNLTQIRALIQTFSPIFNFHPKELYLPSSVPWFFNNGALLYTNSSSNGPVRIDPPGTNLPQGGTNDGAYWLDLPTDPASQNTIKAGNLSFAEAYIHIKPTLDGTATDIVFWLFYPFNGPARARAGFIEISLGRIGEHVGDWEHVTQRFSNFDGEMTQMYFSQHSSGEWVNAAELEYAAVGERRPAAYATLHGHAFYSKAGLVLKGEAEKIGIKDETAEEGAVMDAAAGCLVVSAEHLGLEEPAWLQYMREWGPKVSYDVDKELGKMMRFLPGKMKRGLRTLVGRLPKEMLGEEGPTGPKGKASWNGEES